MIVLKGSVLPCHFQEVLVLVLSIGRKRGKRTEGGEADQTGGHSNPGLSRLRQEASYTVRLWGGVECEYE